MTTVKELISKNKVGLLKWLSPYDKVNSAIQKMADNDLGAMLVLDNGTIVGVFSEKDYARRLLLEGRSSFDTCIHEVMERKVIYVTPEYELEECLALMTSKHIRNLPVIDNGVALYLLSIDEVSMCLLEGKEFMIASLTQYITGTPMFNQSMKDKLIVRELYFDLEEKNVV